MKLRVLLALVSVLVLVASVSVFSPAQAASEAYVIDPVHSTVLFRVKHMNVSYAYGRFNEFSGKVTLDDANATAASVEFTVETKSVDTGNDSRDEHLRGPDFFNAAQFATITFKSTSVKKVDDTHVDVTGDLTMHGATKPATVRMEKTGAGKGRDGEALVGFEGTFTVQRAQFGMDYGIGALGDDVRVTISVEAAKAKK